MSYQYFDAQGNNYVRPWNNDFTDAEKRELGIGEYRDPATYTMPTAEQEQQTAEILESFGEHNSWPGNPEEILQRMQDEERLKQSGERFPMATEQDHSWPWKDPHPLAPVGNPDRRDPWDGRRTPNSWDPSRRFEDAGYRGRDMMDRGYEGPIRDRGGAWDTINPLGPRSERIEVIPYSEEETNARKWGLLNSFVDLIKRTGGKLMDRYQQNKEDRRKWQKENPGGYPGMPQHLRERIRRNQMSSIDGQQIAGYDPTFGDTFGSDDTDLNMAIPDPDRPTIYGSDVLDLLIQQEKVKNPSRSNNGWA